MRFFLLSIFFIYTSAVDCAGRTSIQSDRVTSSSSVQSVQQTSLPNSDSQQLQQTYNALLEKLADLYRQLKAYVEQYDVTKEQMKFANEAYLANRSKQNYSRLQGLENNARAILAQIETLMMKIRELENNQIPDARSKLPAGTYQDSDGRAKFIISVIDNIKAEVGELTGKYPELDALVNDRANRKTPIYPKKQILRKSENPKSPK